MKTITLESLKVKHDIINLEASVPSHSMEAFTNPLPNFFSDVKSFITDLFDFSKEPNPGLLDIKGFFGSKPVNYIDIANKPIYVPPGLVKPIPVYLDALEKAQNTVDRLQSEVLEPFSVWIALNLSDPTRLATITNDRTVVGLRFHDVADVTKEIAKCFHAGSTKVDATFGEMYRRNADYAESVKRVNSLNERALGISNTAILNKVAEISQNLDLLLSRIKSEPDVYRLSGNSAKVISTVCYNMAKECEFYAAYRHMLTNLIIAMQDSEKVLLEYLDAEKVKD